MGTWLKELLKKRHINSASVAKTMGVTANTFQSYFAATLISDDVLKRITAAIGFDLYSLAKEEQARRTVGPQVVDSKAASTVEEPSARYGHVRAGGKDAWLMTLNLDDFDEAEQLKIVRFLQQLPRRGAKGQAIG
jgi:hypothetical protein